MCHPRLSREPRTEEQGTSPPDSLTSTHPHTHTHTHTHTYTHTQTQYSIPVYQCPPRFSACVSLCRCWMCYCGWARQCWGKEILVRRVSGCVHGWGRTLVCLQSKRSRCVRWESCRLSARDSLQLHDHTHTHTHTQEHTLLICLLVWVWETLANKQTPSRVTTYWFHAHRSRRVCHAEKTKSVSQQRTAFFERKHFSLNKMFYPFRERLQWRIWMKISENAAIFRSIR